MVTTRNQAQNQNPTHGTKVTPSGAPEIEEGAGAVASDSLAADSDRAGGKFGENRGSEPQGVSGSNSTFANTNTSGATILKPAPDKEARDSGSGSYPGSLGGQAKDLAVEDTSGSADAGLGGTSSAGVAPTYVNSQAGGGLPKGRNLTEGGFESDDSKNASFNGDIGGKNDPGRLAEEKFIRDNANASEHAGMPRQPGFTGSNTYEGLGDTSA